MKTVNLEEILEEKGFDVERFRLENPYSTTNLFLAMREACNQCLDLAARTPYNIYDDNGKAYISRESILNIKSQII